MATGTAWNASRRSRAWPRARATPDPTVNLRTMFFAQELRIRLERLDRLRAHEARIYAGLP